jgi:hypothetical protein
LTNPSAEEKNQLIREALAMIEADRPLKSTFNNRSSLLDQDVFVMIVKVRELSLFRHFRTEKSGKSEKRHLIYLLGLISEHWLMYRV